MRLNDMRAEVSALREERDGLHDELHALLEDKAITVGEREEKEADIRGQIRAINDRCYPMEVVLGKMRKLSKGVVLEGEEKAIYDDAVAQIGEVTL